jgi:SAM-dependent methyltransferase
MPNAHRLDLGLDGVAAHYYDQRFRQGYMEDWPVTKRTRVAELIRLLDLPRKGTALDFGCGTGAFTTVLCEALPGWIIEGCDISRAAVELAAKRLPGGTFFPLSDCHLRGPFDLIFTHHVLRLRLFRRQVRQCSTSFRAPIRAVSSTRCASCGLTESEQTARLGFSSKKRAICGAWTQVGSLHSGEVMASTWAMRGMPIISWDQSRDLPLVPGRTCSPLLIRRWELTGPPVANSGSSVLVLSGCGLLEGRQSCSAISASLGARARAIT